MKLSLSEKTFIDFQSLLIEESGLNFPRDKIGRLEESLQERIKACGKQSFEEYLYFLKHHSDGASELKALYDLVTIGETFFFRNEHQFDALRNHAIPAIIEKRTAGQDKEAADRTLRIWCAGCSSGEEAYSIAMLLRENLPSFKSWDVSILATDINRRSLTLAQNAAYNSRAVELIPPDYMEKYFKKSGRSHYLSEEIKRMVKFQYHNLGHDSFSALVSQPLDILFCRNVLIYFDFSKMQQIIDQFADVLSPWGFLFLGHAETLWNVSNRFHPVEFPKTFIYQKASEMHAASSRPILPLPELPLSALCAKPKNENLKLRENALQATIDVDSAEKTKVAGEPAITAQEKQNTPAEDNIQTVLSAYEMNDVPKALKIIEECLSGHSSDPQMLFLKAVILSNSGQYEEGLGCLNDILRKDNLNVAAYYLRGILSSKLNQYESAAQDFKRVIYVDSSLAVVYFHLADIERHLGRVEEAQKHYRNCLKLLDGISEDKAVDMSEGLTAGLLRQAAGTALETLTGT
jgi:chemotaxis protein methyltransferase CheR